MKNRVVKTVLFTVLLFLCVFRLQRVLNVSQDHPGYYNVHDFYEERPNTLDAVYIGSSNTYTFWQGPLGWDEYGIAVYPFATAGMPAAAFKYYMEEARKTQPDALYIFQVNCFKANVRVASTHTLVDYMKLSSNKVKMIHDFSQKLNMNWSESLEFYFPSIRFHSRWSTLTSFDIMRPATNIKGSPEYKSHLWNVRADSDPLISTEERVALSAEQAQVVEDLLDYCDLTHPKVLFVIVPQIEGETLQGQFNTLKDYISSRGYDVLDLRYSFDGIGIDFLKDYRDHGHLNIHGSLKYIDFFGQYLCENYGFKDKRGDPAYASWDDAVVNYHAIISPATLEFERKHLARDFSLLAPNVTIKTASSKSVSIIWSEIQEADGYEIYRKCPKENKGYWTLVDSVAAETLQYLDEATTSGRTYTYTIVPFRNDSGERHYGNFNYSGVKAST